jgi:hypothetical protein
LDRDPECEVLQIIRLIHLVTAIYGEGGQTGDTLAHMLWDSVRSSMALKVAAYPMPVALDVAELPQQCTGEQMPLSTHQSILVIRLLQSDVPNKSNNCCGCNLLNL